MPSCSSIYIQTNDQRHRNSIIIVWPLHQTSTRFNSSTRNASCVVSALRMPGVRCGVYEWVVWGSWQSLHADKLRRIYSAHSPTVYIYIYLNVCCMDQLRTTTYIYIHLRDIRILLLLHLLVSLRFYYVNVKCVCSLIYTSKEMAHQSTTDYQITIADELCKRASGSECWTRKFVLCLL